MLKSLEIKNYALIQNFDIRFTSGLHIITGETGAGKSILLGALGLVLGKRADSKVLFNQDEKCIVEARFDLGIPGVKEFLEANDLDADEEMCIRREITPAGKSRAFINDTPVTLDLIQEISGQLIDIHQQFDTISFQKAKQQAEALDAMIAQPGMVLDYRLNYQQYKKMESELNQLKSELQLANKEMDYLLFQLKELEDLGLKPGEQEELETSIEKMSNAEEIKKVFSSAASQLEGNENAIVDVLTDINREIAHLKNIDPNYQELHQRLDAVIVELKDIANEAGEISEGTEYDAAQLEANQERLTNIFRLQKKHGVSNNNDLLTILDELKLKTGKFTSLDDEIEKKGKESIKLHSQLQSLAQKISTARIEVAPIMEQQVNELLGQLSMPNARLRISVSPGEELNERGMDQVAFLFSANKGGELQPIKEVASGGELARLTLCIKSILASKMKMPTMVFDEIDTGVSGAVASTMGNILHHMSTTHQLIVITHSPQIAAKADNHYFVFKKDAKERTISQIRLLSQEERVSEIAKMLSGEHPGKAAIENAKELLKR